MTKKKHQRQKDIKCTPEKGGGETLVEPGVGRTPKQMYERLLKTGELQRAMAIKTNRHLSKEQTVALMKNARPALPYIEQNEMDDISKNAEKINNLRDNIKANKEKKKQDEINLAIKEQGRKEAIAEMEAQKSNGGSE